MSALNTDLGVTSGIKSLKGSMNKMTQATGGDVAASLEGARRGMPALREALSAAGWDVREGSLQLEQESARVRFHEPSS